LTGTTELASVVLGNWRARRSAKRARSGQPEQEAQPVDRQHGGGLRHAVPSRHDLGLLLDLVPAGATIRLDDPPTILRRLA
jgi:hypothetical protein